jgi:hypothetical protein
MKEETLKRIFEFLEEKGEHNAPFRWKILNNKPITKEDLKVGGNLDLRFEKITSLPDGLKVDGDLELNVSNIKSLPKGLNVRGNLDLRYTNITSLPKGLEVHSGLIIKKTALLEYTDEELREMIKPGFIDGEIFR